MAVLATLGVAVASHPGDTHVKTLTHTQLTAQTTYPGYDMIGADGGVFDFGGSANDGSTYTDGLSGLSGPHPLNAPIVGAAATPNHLGYWMVGADGGVFNFGNATYDGSTYTYGITGLGGSHPLNAPIVGMAADPNGNGYWLVGADGGVFNFGGAPNFGSTYSYGLTGLGGSHPLAAPIVAIIPTPNGGGYWLIGKDGGVFNFGDAGYYGSTYSYGLTGLGGSHPLNAPIVGGAATPNGQGFWLVGADGGLFNFGDATNYGSTYSYGLTGLGGSHPLNAPIVTMLPGIGSLPLVPVPLSSYYDLPSTVHSLSPGNEAGWALAPSNNVSGDVRGVSTTFTVPQPDSAASSVCENSASSGQPCETAAWVAIDGSDNNNPTTLGSVLRAGVVVGNAAAKTFPSMGSSGNMCGGSGEVCAFYSYTNSNGNTQTVFFDTSASGLLVSSGNTINVTITDNAGWYVNIKDVSTGQSVSESVPYDGPGNDAEFFVSSPDVLQGNYAPLEPTTSPIAFTDPVVYLAQSTPLTLSNWSFSTNSSQGTLADSNGTSIQTSASPSTIEPATTEPTFTVTPETTN